MTPTFSTSTGLLLALTFLIMAPSPAAPAGQQQRPVQWPPEPTYKGRALMSARRSLRQELTLASALLGAAATGSPALAAALPAASSAEAPGNAASSVASALGAAPAPAAAAVPAVGSPECAEQGPLSPACLQWWGPGSRRYIRVATTYEVQAAIDAALPGDLIELLPGIYDAVSQGPGLPLLNIHVDKKHGLPDAHITVCGPRDAVITGEANYESKPYIVHIQDSSYVTLAGLTLRVGIKGLVVEHSQYLVLQGLRVEETDYEGVRLRHNSTFNVVRECEVANTGRTAPGKGEGIYLGSSTRNSPEGPDHCDYNQVLYNTIGPGVPAEMIDIKENSSGGLVEGNRLDGRDLSGENSANSWVDVKGHFWVVKNNVGANALESGFSTQDQDPALSGFYNVFEGNTCYGLAPGGLCVKIHCSNPQGCHNSVACNNVAADGSGGAANVPCSSIEPQVQQPVEAQQQGQEQQQPPVSV